MKEITLFDLLAGTEFLTDKGYEYQKKTQGIFSELTASSFSLEVKDYYFYSVTLQQKRTIKENININLSEYEYFNYQF